MKLITAPILLLQQFAAILDEYLQQMQFVRWYRNAISKFFLSNVVNGYHTYILEQDR